jgi:adenylate cyclase
LTCRPTAATLGRVSLHFQKRMAALCLIGLCSGIGGLLLHVTGALRDADNLFYDLFYRHRAIENQTGGPVVIVAADDNSLTRLLAEKKLGWPWPRDEWGAIIQYVASHGAKAVVVDLLFTEPSIFERDFQDDDALADAVDGAGIPVVFGAYYAYR